MWSYVFLHLWLLGNKNTQWQQKTPQTQEKNPNKHNKNQNQKDQKTPKPPRARRLLPRLRGWKLPTLQIYWLQYLTTNAYWQIIFSEGSAQFPVFLLPSWQDYLCPLALFLLQYKGLRRAGLPWKRQPLSVVALSLGWFLPSSTNSGQKQPPQKTTLATKMTPSSSNDTYSALQPGLPSLWCWELS